MCAIEAGRRGRRVAILERASRPGKKILISGGGRCNFTNIHCRPENFLSENPHFAKSALARYTPADFLALVEKHRIPWHEKNARPALLRPLSSDILNMLLAEATEAGSHPSMRHKHHRSRVTIDAFHVANTQRRIPRLRSRRRHGRPLHPQNGRNQLRLRPRPPVRPQNHRTSPRACSASFSALPISNASAISPASQAEVIATVGRRQLRREACSSPTAASAVRPSCKSLLTGTPAQLSRSISHRSNRSLLNSSSHRDLPTVRAHLRTVLPQRLADRLLDLDPPAGWSNSRPRSMGGPLASLAHHARRHRGLREGRSHRRRHRHRRALRQNHGEPHSRPLLHRRSRRRHRPSRRIQLPVGLGLWGCRRTRYLTRAAMHSGILRL